MSKDILDQTAWDWTEEQIPRQQAEEPQMLRLEKGGYDHADTQHPAEQTGPIGQLALVPLLERPTVRISNAQRAGDFSSPQESNIVPFSVRRSQSKRPKRIV